MRYFKEYLNTVLPEELFSDTPVIKDVIDIFVEYIEEYITPVYNLDYIYSMKNKKISEELFKTHLYDLFTIFAEAQQNTIILKELQLVMNNINVNYNSYSSVDMLNVLTLQHLKSAKSYKQKKGTKTAIEYVYNLVKSSGFQPFSVIKNKNDFVFEINGEEYHFDKIEGSLIAKIYHNVVALATHPVGFTYNYEMKTVMELLDYFGYNLVYNISDLYITYINGTTINLNTKPVVDIYVEDDYIKFVFNDGTYLIKNIGDIKLFNDDDTINTEYSNTLLTYNYTVTLEKTITDEYSMELESYDCDWFDVNTTSTISIIGKTYSYNIGNLNIDNGVVGLSPFVLCDITSSRQHLSDAPSLYTSSEQLIQDYINTPYEIHITAHAGDNIECNGYGIVCGHTPGYSEICNENIAFDRLNNIGGIKHHIAVDVIDIQLIAD